MRLKLTMKESQCRDELIANRNGMMAGSFDDERIQRLCSVLREHGAELSRTYVLDWLVDQGEDFYEVLVGKEVLRLEIPRDGSGSDIQRIPLSEYRRRRHGARQNTKLSVALDLLAETQPAQVQGK